MMTSPKDMRTLMETIISEGSDDFNIVDTFNDLKDPNGFLTFDEFNDWVLSIYSAGQAGRHNKRAGR